MNRFIVPLGVFALLAIVLAIGIKHSPDKGTIASPLIGKPAPQFALPVLTDARRTFRSTELKGRWYVFNVWGTWCVACREEHNVLLKIRQTGLVPVIGLDWRDQDAQALDWLTQSGNPYEVVAVDRDGRTAIDWGVYGAPETFLVDPHGIVVYKFIGPMTLDVWQSEFVRRVRSGKATNS
ncbi:MAG TPA: DsbE family thiol:disulfide interchange protein [Steroidobacteraceae bacterium]